MAILEMHPHQHCTIRALMAALGNPSRTLFNV
jgi:hypothetical protein